MAYESIFIRPGATRIRGLGRVREGSGETAHISYHVRTSGHSGPRHRRFRAYGATRYPVAPSVTTPRVSST
eukprot:896759-Pyramimonas_sp.AAC.1